MIPGDPKRLVDDGSPEFARSLLDAASADQPTEHARRRAMTTLGIATMTAVASGVVTAAGVGAAKSTGTFGWVFAAKWMALVVVPAAIGVTAAVYFANRSHTTPARETASTVAATPANAPAIFPTPCATVPAVGLPPAEAPAVQATARPAANAANAAPTFARPLATAPASVPATSTPSRRREAEIAQFDAARIAYSKGNLALCLGELDKYDHDYPDGLLREEATVLRIDALAKSGNSSTARKLAEAFIAAHPQSPHVPRLRSLLAEP